MTDRIKIAHFWHIGGGIYQCDYCGAETTAQANHRLHCTSCTVRHRMWTRFKRAAGMDALPPEMYADNVWRNTRLPTPQSGRTE